MYFHELTKLFVLLQNYSETFKHPADYQHRSDSIRSHLLPFSLLLLCQNAQRF